MAMTLELPPRLLQRLLQTLEYQMLLGLQLQQPQVLQQQLAW
jgi:hypothetical protein